MVNKKILLLSTYPIRNPQHGGQKRARAIYEIYKDNFTKVRHSAVFFKGFYSDYDVDDVPLSRASEQLVMQSPLTGDIVCGEAIYKDVFVKKKMSDVLLELQPDIVHIEQPFPYLGLRPLLDELNMKPNIVFGSQNIEAPMKREILEGANTSIKITEDVVNIIAELEHNLSSTSDLVVACTTEDVNAHIRMGAKETVLAPNGIAPIKSNQNGW